jgi:hypothetical protein
MKNLKIHIKHLISPALVGLLTLIALLSYSWGQPAPSVLANREASSDIAHQTSLPTTGGSPSSSLSKLHQPTQPPISETYGKMPLYFIENRGQVDSRVAYYVQGIDKSVYFTPQGITFVLTGQVARHDAEPSAHNASLRSVSLRTEAHTEDAMQQYALKLDFIGARRGVRPTGQDLTSATINYFKGTKDQWKTGLKTYSTLIYSDLWPGIDLIYTGTVEQMKYTFIVKPGADPSQIKLAYRGASEVKLNNAGQLEVITPAGGFHDETPYSYQEVDGNRVKIDTAYALHDKGITAAHRYGFHLGEYDRSKPLMIDPAVRVYTGFIGGAGNDQGNGIAVDNLGNAYVVGTTTSRDFPTGTATSPGRIFSCPDGFIGCTGDAFVVKIKANGTGLVYAGYIGGRGTNEGRGIAVDSQGRAYVTGMTDSNSFPHKKLRQRPIIFFNAAFVVRVTADGSDLDYAGIIDGDNDDEGNGIAVDGDFNAYVVGTTNSSKDNGFPVTVGTLSSDLNHGAICVGGCKDAFVAKIHKDGIGVEYCGYIGGKGNEEGKGIAVDEQNRAYLTGTTESNEKIPGDEFPVRTGPDRTFNGGTDAFVARVTKDGRLLDYCGYLGGGDNDEGNAIAVDANGNAYVTGTTSSVDLPDGLSIGRRFPSPNPFFGCPSAFCSSTDAFVVKVNANGTGFDYAGYIGGFADEEGRGIALDNNNNAYVTGFTDSSADRFPDGEGVCGKHRCRETNIGPDLVLTGTRDAFIVKVKSDGTAFGLVTYIGGVGEEEGNGIAVDQDGNAYVTGFTNSPRLDSDRFRVPASPDRTFNGGDSDAFVEKIGAATSRVRPPTPIRSLCPDDITVTALPGENSAVVNYPPPNVGHLADVVVVSSPPSGSVFPVGTTEVTIIEIDTFGDTGVLCTFTVTVNPAGPPPLALSCVGGLHVVMPPGQPTVVNYPLPVLNKPEGATVVCLPPPGSVFPVGMTTVTCTATNTLGETAACSFIADVVE